MSSRLITRAGIISVVSFLTVMTGMQSAAADVLIPRADNGGSGGAMGGIGVLDETDRAIALIELSGNSAAVYHPTANERSIQLIESTFAEGGVLAGAPVVHHPTANEQSIQRVESTFTENGGLAGAPEVEVAVQPSHGQPY